MAAAEKEGEAEGAEVQAAEDKEDADFKPDQPEAVTAADGAPLFGTHRSPCLQSTSSTATQGDCRVMDGL